MNSSGVGKDRSRRLPPAAVQGERRPAGVLNAELDACYARLYGLTREQLPYS